LLSSPLARQPNRYEITYIGVLQFKVWIFSHHQYYWQFFLTFLLEAFPSWD
jgi:hypothetical protein